MRNIFRFFFSRKEALIFHVHCLLRRQFAWNAKACFLGKIRKKSSICHLLNMPTVLSTSLGKTFFAWRFILNENILFWLTISYEKPFGFSLSVFCSQMCTLKLNLLPKVGMTYAISIVKWFFEIFVLVNIFYFPLLNLNYWCFKTILWKFQKNWTSKTCWKSASKLPTLQISA